VFNKSPHIQKMIKDKKDKGEEFYL
jgi:hypothetical protein